MFALGRKRTVEVGRVKLTHRERYMKLQDQITVLSNIGLPLKEDVTIDDLRISFTDTEFEKDPYRLLLHMLGAEIEAEPLGRRFCDYAMNIWMQRIYRSGDYTSLINELSNFAGSTRVTVISDRLSRGTAHLRYRVGDETREFSHKVESNTFDPDVITQLMRDIQGDGKAFAMKPDGFSMPLYYLSEGNCRELVQLDMKNIFALLDD
jgi:hypothetical protein